VNSRIAFAGFELMDSETAMRLSKVHKKDKAPAAGGDGHLAEGERADKLPF
jgi:hypothetical protein